MTTSRRRRPIDRVIPGVGRLTIRAEGLSKSARDELDRYIVRARDEQLTEQLRMLKRREVSPGEFLQAGRDGRLAALRASPAIEPLLERWLASAGLRPSSIARYRQSWRFILESLPHQPRLSDITNEWWYEFVATRPVKESTLNRDRMAVVAFVNWAASVGHPLPEAFSVPRRREEPKRSRILTPEEVQALEAACPPERWAFFATLLYTGARTGEVLNLRIEDLSMVPPAIVIRSQVGSKSRGRQRSVPIDLELLGQIMEEHDRESGRVFPFTRYTIQHWWDQLCTDTGIKDVTLHGFRATFITNALDAGIAPTQVQKLVGHSSIVTTMDYYRNPKESHVAAATIREAIRHGIRDPREGETVAKQVVGGGSQLGG